MAKSIVQFGEGSFLGADLHYAALFVRHSGKKWMRINQKGFNEMLAALRKEGAHTVLDELSKRNPAISLVISNFLSKTIDTKGIGNQIKEIIETIKSKRGDSH